MAFKALVPLTLIGNKPKLPDVPAAGTLVVELARVIEGRTMMVRHYSLGIGYVKTEITHPSGPGNSHIVDESVWTLPTLRVPAYNPN